MNDGAPRAGRPRGCRIDPVRRRPRRLLRGRIVVTPVAQGSCAAVDLVERAGEGRDMGNVRRVPRGRLPVHAREVFDQRPVAADEPQRRLPRVQVRVHEAGHDDATGEVDDLGGGDVEAVTDLRDVVVLDEDVGAFRLWAVRRQGDHLRSAQQCALHA